MVIGEATIQNTTTTNIQATYSATPTHEFDDLPVVMWLTLPTKPVMKTIAVWTKMKISIQIRITKWMVRATCRLKMPEARPNRLAIAGACSRPVMSASGDVT